MTDSFFFLHGTQYALSRPTRVVINRASDVTTKRAVDGTIVSTRAFGGVLRDPVHTIRFEWSDTDSATRCLHDHVQALCATGAPVWLQCDGWLDYTDVLLIADPDDDHIVWAQHDTIRPPDFHPGFQNFETWTGHLRAIAADGTETVVDDADFTVDYQTGQVTLAPGFTVETGMTFRLSYIYHPMVVVTECALTPESEEWGDEEYIYETHTYRGTVTFQVVTPTFSTYLPNPTFTGCLERSDTTDFSDVEKDFPDDGPIIPPYPEPGVIYKTCYPDNSRWQDIRGTFYTTPTMSEIPLGNVISGAEFFEITAFIWERTATGTYSITGVYRLIQSAVADRAYTKPNQYGGVYDTAKQGFISSSTTKTVMGEYYDSEWPVTFGRATPAQHRGQFYGSIAHVTTPDNSTRFPVRNDGSSVEGSGYGRYQSSGSLTVATFNSPVMVIDNTKDSTNGVYTSLVSADWQEFPDWGVIPVSGRIQTARALPGYNDDFLHMGSEAFGRIYLRGVFNWIGPTIAPQQYVTQSSRAVAFARMEPAVTPPSTQSTVRGSVSVSPYAKPIVDTDTDTHYEVYVEANDVPASYGDGYTISGSGTGESQAQWRDSVVIQTVTSLAGQRIEIEAVLREYYEKTTLAIYHGPPVLSRLIRCSTFTVLSGSVTLSDVTEDDVTFKRITNGTGLPAVFEVKIAAFADAANAQQALWVCGFSPAIRARSSAGPMPVDVKVFRNSSGSLSGTALTSGNFDTEWKWQFLGGPRETMGHDQTSSATWKITELSGGYMTITGLLLAGAHLDVRVAGCRFYMVPSPSKSVTGDY